MTECVCVVSVRTAAVLRENKRFKMWKNHHLVSGGNQTVRL